MAHFSVVNGAGSRRKAQQGSKTPRILKALPAATPVPTLGGWALLAAMLGFVGLRRRA